MINYDLELIDFFFSFLQDEYNLNPGLEWEDEFTGRWISEKLDIFLYLLHRVILDCFDLTVVLWRLSCYLSVITVEFYTCLIATIECPTFTRFSFLRLEDFSENCIQNFVKTKIFDNLKIFKYSKTAGEKKNK